VIERVLQPDHPASRGHFPGNPIIPGAVLLSETLVAIEAGLGARLMPFQITSAKFLRPTRPGDRVQIEFPAQLEARSGSLAALRGGRC
jgi:3-hydroxymyristoyl/3-hydroxydecanoyl-(acyl carrier protein) dehydratase